MPMLSSMALISARVEPLTMACGTGRASIRSKPLATRSFLSLRKSLFLRRNVSQTSFIALVKTAVLRQPVEYAAPGEPVQEIQLSLAELQRVFLQKQI